MKKYLLLIVIGLSVGLISCEEKCDEIGKYEDCSEWRDAISGTWNGQATCGGISTAKTDMISNGGSLTTIVWSDGFQGELTSGSAFVIPQQDVISNGQITQYSGFGTYSSTELNYTLYATQNGQQITCTMSAGR